MKVLEVKNKENISPEIDIHISGAKNALLHLVFASLLPKSATTFSNVPKTLLDYQGSKDILRYIGAEVRDSEDDSVSICYIAKNSDNQPLEVSHDLTKKTRCSLMLLGSMLKKRGKISIGFPGGCSFSDKRPFDIHLKGLEALGADVYMQEDEIVVSYKEEKDAIFKMEFPSVGATMNLIMYASTGNSKVIIENIALEPEVIALIDYLNNCNANITLDAEKREVMINGVHSLEGCNYKIIFDRIQAMTYAALAYVYKTNVTINNIDSLYSIEKPLEVLTKAQAKWMYSEKEAKLTFFGLQSELVGVDIIAAPFPHFPTDLQPIFAVMLLMATTPSSIQDTVYPERIDYVNQIRKMGINIALDNNLIKISPLESLAKIKSTTMSVKDLRAGMACLIAGGLLDSYSTIENAHQIYRGYSNLISKISNFVDVKDKDIK